jgi:serine/threonine protein kinase
MKTALQLRISELESARGDADELRTLWKRNAALEHEASRHKATINRLEDDALFAVAREKALNGQIASLQSRQEAFVTEVSGLTQELESLRLKAGAGKNESAAEIDRLKQALANEQRKSEGAEQKRSAEHQDEVENLKSELNKSKSLEQKHLSEVDRLLDKAKYGYGAEQKRISELESEVEKLKLELDKSKSALNGEQKRSSELQSDVEKAKSAERKRSSELQNELKSELENAKSSLGKARAELADVNAKLEQKNASQPAVEKELQTLKSANVRLENEEENEALRQEGVSSLLSSPSSYHLETEGRSKSSLPTRTTDWLHQEHSFVLHLQALLSAITSPAMRLAQSRVDTACKALKRDFVAASVASLEELQVEMCETLPQPPVEMIQRRHSMRIALQALIAGEREAIGDAFVALSNERLLLMPVTGPSNVMGARKNALEAAQLLAVDYQAAADEICSLRGALEADELELAKSKWQSGSDVSALRRRIAQQENSLEQLLQRPIDHSAIEKARAQVAAHQLQRCRELNKLHDEMQAYALELGNRQQSLEKAIAAFENVEKTVASVAVCKDALEEAKDDLDMTKLKVKRKKKTDADVADAERAVREARDRYHEALRRLVELRACGYPELSCPAAAPANDFFPNVPTVAFSDVELGARIGGGAFADVFQCELPGSGECAFKKLRQNVAPSVLLKEATALWALRGNPHIVRLLKVCVDEGHQGLVLELAEGGSLGTRLREKVLPDSERLTILHSVASGLAAVHECGHVHLDVKSDNVLLFSRGQAKLSDFGSSKAVAATLRDTMVNKTFRWAAPELLQEPPVISSAADVWSFGMLCYEVATGKQPYHDVASDFAVVGEIIAGKTPSVENLGNVGRIMSLCWTKDPRQRPTMSTILVDLEALLMRECKGCLQSFSLGIGVLSNADAFCCKSCLLLRMEELLTKDLDLRSDGALPWGIDVFPLHRMRDLCDKSLFDRWQAGQLRAREKELTIKFQRELERSKEKWQKEDAIERLALQIENELLGPHPRMYPCPSCRGAFEFESGCMAIRHKIEARGCGQSFCGFCFLVHADSGFLHDHARVCQFNTANRGDYSLPPGRDQQQQFHELQRSRQCRELTAKFATLPDSQRDLLLERLRPLLEARKIRHAGEWRFE